MNSIYRNCIIQARTRQKANLIGSITLINTNLHLGKNVTIYPNCMIWGDGPIEIGNNVDIGVGTILYASKNGGITIEDNTSMAGQCYIIDMDHGIAGDKIIREQSNSVEAVFIGHDVWISCQCAILKGCSIEDGCVVGAKSLLKGRLRKNTISYGCPVKERKVRLYEKEILK